MTRRSRTINVKAGSAIKKGGKTIYYGTVPEERQCPKGGFPIKAEFMFAGPRRSLEPGRR